MCILYVSPNECLFGCGGGYPISVCLVDSSYTSPSCNYGNYGYLRPLVVVVIGTLACNNIDTGKNISVKIKMPVKQLA